MIISVKVVLLLLKNKFELIKFVEEFLKAPKIADAVINCSMDQYHIETTMPLFKLGYDVLLEKPISPNLDELNALRDESKKYHCKLMVCHVLRYAPFYKKAKEIYGVSRILSLEGKVRKAGALLPIKRHNYFVKDSGVDYSVYFYTRNKKGVKISLNFGAMVDVEVYLDQDEIRKLKNHIKSRGGRNRAHKKRLPLRCPNCTARP